MLDQLGCAHSAATLVHQLNGGIDDSLSIAQFLSLVHLARTRAALRMLAVEGGIYQKIEGLLYRANPLKCQEEFKSVETKQ